MKTHTAHMTLVMDRMTEIMAVQHVFDDQVSQPDGGPLKYVLEVGQDRFAVFLSDRSGDMIVSPFEMVDFLEEAEEPIPVLRLGALSERMRSLAELGPAYW